MAWISATISASSLSGAGLVVWLGQVCVWGGGGWKKRVSRRRRSLGFVVAVAPRLPSSSSLPLPLSPLSHPSPATISASVCTSKVHRSSTSPSGLPAITSTSLLRAPAASHRSRCSSTVARYEASLSSEVTVRERPYCFFCWKDSGG